MVLWTVFLGVAMADGSVRFDLSDGSTLHVEMEITNRKEECRELDSGLPEDVLLQWLDQMIVPGVDYQGTVTMNIQSEVSGVLSVKVQGSSPTLQNLAEDLALRLHGETLRPICNGSLEWQGILLNEDDLNEQPMEHTDILPGYVPLTYSDIDLRKQVPLEHASGVLQREIECQIGFYVGVKGRVDQVQVIDCPVQFQTSVQDAGMQWRFRPARDERGKKVPFYWAASHTVFIRSEEN